MSAPVHLLDERDETSFYEQTGPHSPFRRWSSTWFPFHARVQKSPGDWDFAWDIGLVGGHPFAAGKTETRAEAFQAVAEAKREALGKLRKQLESPGGGDGTA